MLKMLLIPLSLYFLLFFTIVTSNTKLEVMQNSDSSVAEKQLKRIYHQTKHMKYGHCWTKAIEELESGCRQLTDETQRRIAYAFARCHLQSSGRQISECKPDQPIADCTNEETLRDVGFNAYTEFFTHTQQICFHLQSQVWHELTESTISKLADNSAELASSLEEGSLIAHQIVERQNESLSNQQELLRNERLLRENMHKTVMDSQRSHEETTAIIREQKLLFAEVFNRVSALQKTMLGEFTSIYTFGFYVGTSVLAYILSSTSRTSSSRIWLFLLITLNFISEKLIARKMLASSSMDGDSLLFDDFVLSEPIYDYLWLCRKFYSVLALLVMLICIIRYRDYGKINNRILNEIKKQNRELQEIFRTSGMSSLNGFDSTPSKTQIVPDCVPRALHDVADNLIEDELNNTDVTTNNLSTITSYESNEDSTYIADDHSRSSASSFASYVTSGSSRSIRSSSVFRSFVRSSTPSGGSISRRSSLSSPLPLLPEELNGSDEVEEGVIIGGHNLRRRSRSIYNNPATGESVESFMESIAKVTMTRRRPLRR